MSAFETSAAKTARTIDTGLGLVQRVRIAALLPADSPRVAGQNLQYAHILANVESGLPPITVRRPSMRVVDGMHRVRAAALRGRTEIEARFFDGGAEDAFVLAVAANAEHGLPLSHADRTAAAARIIASHEQWSDRSIASVTGLAAKTVGALRRRQADGAPPADVRIGLDGRARPLNCADGRRAAALLIADVPGASLREVARKTGISPGTARDVRDRLRRGEDPAPAKRRPALEATSSLPARPAAAAPAYRAAASQRLYRDPALRLTENGRLLLRLLEVHSLGSAQWTQIIDSVPAHCAASVSAAALECAAAWQEFAERIDQGSSTQG